MATDKKAMEEFINDQVKKWKIQTEGNIPVITVSTEPGSGGHVIAKQVANQLQLALYDRDIIKEIAESSHISETVIASMEKERLSGVEDFISSLVDDRYLWPGLYLSHLVKTVSAIASHGNSVIVGRGANFILPPDECLRLRVVAPLDKRVANVVRKYGATEEEARSRIINREKKRGSFIRKSFDSDVSNPDNYDLVINTDKLSIDACVGSIVGTVVGRKKTD